MTSPTYLRDLAHTYERASDKATGPTRAKHLATARRLHEIAGEFDELQARSTGIPSVESVSRITRSLSTGTTHAIARLREHQAAAPTPAELAEIRGLVGGHRKARP